MYRRIATWLRGIRRIARDSLVIIMEIKNLKKFEDWDVIKDRFEIDPVFEIKLAFPCCVCIHRHGTDKDEPCIHCEHNLRAGL